MAALHICVLLCSSIPPVCTILTACLMQNPSANQSRLLIHVNFSMRFLKKTSATRLTIQHADAYSTANVTLFWRYTIGSYVKKKSGDWVPYHMALCHFRVPEYIKQYCRLLNQWRSFRLTPYV